MQFKHTRDAQEYTNLRPNGDQISHEKLKRLVVLVDQFTLLAGCGEIMITSYFRPDDADSYHSRLQAADIRSKDKPDRWKTAMAHLARAVAAVDPALLIYLHPELVGTTQEHVHLAVNDGSIAKRA